MILRERLSPLGDRISLAALEPYWHRARLWWSERSLREQVLLGSLAAIAAFALLLVGIIIPLSEARADARAQIRNAALLEARLRAGGGLANTGRVRRGTASAIITDSAAAAQLTIQRIEPEGGFTRVVFTDTSFDLVLTWIADVEQTSRLRIRDADIERKPAPGMVSASLLVEG